MRIILTALLLVLGLQTHTAQVKRSNNTNSKNIGAKITDSAKWREANYVVDRNAAYKDPRLGIQKLMGGNRRFLEGKSIRPRQDASTIKKLEYSQAPFAAIVACSDSRVPSELIFDQGMGDLFIVRTAGQVSAAASYGTMEYAVLKLKTKLIVVMGHTECGAVAAAVERPENVPGHIVTLINDIKSAASKSSYLPGNHVNNAVRQNVIDQVTTLRDLEPILHKKFVDGEILIVGAVYDVHTGKVEFLPETLQNLPTAKPAAAAQTSGH